MAIFYHSQPRGFYHENINGFRQVQVPDPDWVRPIVDVELQPGESRMVDGELIENTGDEPMVIQVPDDTIQHPSVAVDNPDCKIPVNAKLITPEQYQALLDGESQGQIISEDADGFPILMHPPPPSAEQLAAAQRGWRDRELTATDRMVARHRDEIEEGSATTLVPEQYVELQTYRRELRAWPESPDFPSEDHRPDKPAWLDQPTP